MKNKPLFKLIENKKQMIKFPVYFIYDQKNNTNVNFKNLELSECHAIDAEDNRVEGLEVICTTREFYELFSELIQLYKGGDFIRFLLRFTNLLSSRYNKEDIKKLRGDFAELVFIKKIGGRKLNDSSVADIVFNDNYVEVKSFSKTQETIIVSNAQLESKARFSLVSVSFLTKEDGGVNIIELAKKISFIDTDFSDEIIKKYSKTFAEDYYFKIEEPLYWEKIEPLTIKHPIIDLKAKIKFDRSKLPKFKCLI